MTTERRTELPGLMPTGLTVTQMAAIEGCLRYLGRQIDTAWLFGGTGYAFMMNIPEDVHCMGPSAWDHQWMRRLTPNLGFSTEHCIQAETTQPDFSKRQLAARRFVEDKLAAGIPCYGAEFGYPEFLTIHACCDEGLYCRHCYEDGELLRPWSDYGVPDVGHLLVVAVEPLNAVADDRRTVADALAFALRLEQDKSGWITEYATGLASYERWIACLESGAWRNDTPYGVPHNANTWHECRSYAGPFLKQAGERLGGPLRDALEEAAEHYGVVAEALGAVRARFHWDRPDVSDAVAHEAADLLRTARAAEELGLATLAEVLQQLQSE